MVQNSLIPVSEERYLAEHNTIMRGVIGSTSHGLNLEGTDDRDEMGIFIEPPDYVLGLRHIEQWTYRTQPQGERSGVGDLDLTIYSLKKYCSLAAKGNPSILILLFLPIETYTVLFNRGAELRQNRDKFVSRMALRRFLGYMTAQKERLFGERGGMRVNRPELVEKYGFDTKYAMHCLRIGYQGIELGATENITLPMSEQHRSFLMDVRTGKIPLEEVKKKYTKLEEILKSQIDAGLLKQDPDWFGINRLMMSMYMKHWENNLSLQQARKVFG